MHVPLAEQLRPKTLDDFVGQSKLVGNEGVLRKVILSDKIPSMIFWGPPGTGKTTLAHIIAHESQRPFYGLSAVDSGVKQVREAIIKANRSDFFNQPSPILFIDEIHRFNKAQQDALLKAVERGQIVLIGATTENPSFEVNNALLSRCQVFILEPHDQAALNDLIDRALDKIPDFRQKNIQITERKAILKLSGGDARKLYNILEIILSFAQEGDKITDEEVHKLVQSRLTQYDKDGEQHYDIISAFIKSIRGSDPNGAIYWLARMIEGGEDPKFICRRLIISAAEDIGLANPNALLIARSCLEAVHAIGMPEGRIIMSEAVIYLALSPKSNAAYTAIDDALALVRKTGDLPVPLHLRNAPTKLMKDIGYGKKYDYSHDNPGNFAEQLYLPEELKGTMIYRPGQNPREQTWQQWMRENWKSFYNYE